VVNENCSHKCSRFCFDEVDACLKIAQSSPKHRESFVRTADHWNVLAKACDGELHPWRSWCNPDTRSALDSWEVQLVSADHFRQELLSWMKRAVENGATDVLINSAELRHSLRGGDFGVDVCCDVMEAEMKPGDVLVLDRTSGAGLTVRYLLPRTDH
jgi:hypothetical protein